VLVVVPIALVAFAVAAVGRLRPEMTGLVAGAGLLGFAFGLLPALVMVGVGVAAFPLFAAERPRAAGAR
jgi:hypothetical protein